MIPPEKKRAWPPLEFGDDLFLVPVRRVRHDEHSVVYALGGELSFVHARRALIRVCVFWTRSGPAALAPITQAASHWNGCVLHFNAYRVLCGQRQEFTPVAGTSGDRTLDLPERSGITDPRLCSVSTPTGCGLRSLTSRRRVAQIV